MSRPPLTGLARVRALAFGIGLLGAAALLIVPGPTTELRHGSVSAWVVWGLVVAGFVVAELLVFHIELRREAITMSLSEVPLAFGLVFLSPVALVSARLLAVAVAKGSTLRSAPHKFQFNVPLVFTETALAALLLRAVTGAEMWQSPTGWAVLLVAVALPSVLSAFFVGLAVMWAEGGAGRVVFRASGLQLYHPATASIAVLSVMPWVVAPSLGWLPVVPLAAMWLVLRSHGEVNQRYRDLNDVSGFNSTLAASPRLDDVLPGAVEHIRVLLRAERAYLAVRRWDGTESVAVAAHDDVESAIELGGRCRFEEVRPDGPVILPRREGGGPLADALAGLDYRQAIVSPVGDGSDHFGVLVVVDRSGVATSFTPNDLPRVEALVQQLIGAIRNGRLHQEIEYQATHDRLTALPNRGEFEALVAHELPVQDSLALVVVEIDQLGEVNDTLGHDATEDLVQAVAERLRSAVPAGSILGRVRDHAFAIALPGGSRERATGVIAAVSEVLAEPEMLRGLHVVVSATAGVAIAPTHGTAAATLLRRADVAVGVARANHRPMCSYSPEIDVHSEARLALMADLGSALDAGELEVNFQPKLDLGSGSVAGVEVLVRWNHPERGYISPADFIPTVERTPLIGDLTDYVIDRGLQMVDECRREGLDLSVAVNVSATDFLDEALPDRVRAALARRAVDAGRLTVEVTETAAISDSQRTKQVLARLHRLGIDASIDDFGTGYSSLTYLRDLAVAEVKIDQRFVRNLLLDEEDAFIVQSVIDLAHNLRLRVVAEGVENPETLDWLTAAGCDQAQGYAIARPLDGDQLIRWLRARVQGGVAEADPSVPMPPR